MIFTATPRSLSKALCAGDTVLLMAGSYRLWPGRGQPTGVCLIPAVAEQGGASGPGRGSGEAERGACLPQQGAQG